MDKPVGIRKQVLWLVLFSTAMGFLESAVVVYLRAIYYPEGFLFPLQPMASSMVITELLREAATVIMLVGVAAMAGRSFNQRFAFFLIAFAVWDLFYYVFLKLLIDWPESLLTWDILFLIPVPWIGPVLAPCLVCVTMLLLSYALLDSDRRSTINKLTAREWLLLILGSLVVVLSWTWDYTGYAQTAGQSAMAFSSFVPAGYNWWLFLVGEALLLVPTFLFWRKTQRTTIHETVQN